ncbi:hypothetical protein Tco_0771534 [Tanacetum coccineum]|uniref:RING-type domain-containing protein n=1 Tax=Tanacetum coccineum TaxID=301880 RepID=A0ABQ4ZJD5_9ASTR
MSSIVCHDCGSLWVNFRCPHCTCARCGLHLNDEFCSFCNSGTFVHILPSFNDPQNFSDHPPQPQHETYTCELCGNDAHFGYDCQSQVPFVYNQDPRYNQDFNFPQNSSNCGGPHETFQCQPINSGFDQIEPPQFPVIHQPPHESSMEALQAREDLMKSIESFLKKFNRISFQKTPKVLMQAWDNFFKIKHAQSEEAQDMLSKLLQDLQSINEELAEFINHPSWNLPTSSYDDDDDEYSFAQKYLMTCSTAVTPDSPVTDSLIMGDEHLDTIPETESDELIKSSVENLVQIPSESEDSSECECDLPPYNDSSKNHNLTFSNPLFDIDEDFTSSDESFSEEDVPNENFKIFSNPLFDLDEEITSTKVDQIDDEVLGNTNSIPPGIEYLCFNAESDLLESLLHRDTSINDSQKIDSLLDEFAGELTLRHSIPPGIDDVNLDPEGDILFLESLLYDNSSPRPPEEFNSENPTESFSPSPIPVEDSDSLMEEIDIFLDGDKSIPPGIESDDFDSEDDNNSTFLPEFESFHVDYPDSGDSTIDVVEDIPVDVPNILPTHPALQLDFDFIPSNNDVGSNLDALCPSDA